MHLGEIIKKYRTEHKMSMEEFAKKASLSKAYISMLEKNEDPRTKKEITPSIPTIQKVSSALGITFDDLFNQMDNDSKVLLNFDDTLQTSPDLTEIVKYSSKVDESRQLLILNYAKEQYEEQQLENKENAEKEDILKEIEDYVDEFGVEAFEDLHKIITSKRKNNAGKKDAG